MSETRNRSQWLGLLAIVPLAVAVTGCGVVDALGLQKPTARIAGIRLQDIDLTAVTMLFDVELENPYSAPLPLLNLDYGLASAGKPFLSGEAELQGAVPAQSTKTVSLPAKVTYKDLLAVLSDVKLGSVVPYRAELGLSVDPPALGTMRLPLKKEGQLPVPAPPEVKVQEIRWDDLTLDSAGGTVKLHVINRNQFPVEMARLAYGLTLSNVEVANASVAKPLTFAASGGAAVIEVPIFLSPKKLGLAAFGMLRGQGANYKLTGDMAATTPFGPMKLPFRGIGKTLFKR
jgi:LEA14-like dessication related protein